MDIREYARIGAEARLTQLQKEERDIYAQFPGLRNGRAAASMPAPRQRRKMSAAARKKISDAQKKRWAAQRATATATVGTKKK